MLKFIFLGLCARTPMSGRGYYTLPEPTPLGTQAPHASLGAGFNRPPKPLTPLVRIIILTHGLMFFEVKSSVY